MTIVIIQFSSITLLTFSGLFRIPNIFRRSIVSIESIESFFQTTFDTDGTCDKSHTFFIKPPDTRTTPTMDHFIRKP
jgi:hypothetical protein